MPTANLDSSVFCSISSCRRCTGTPKLAAFHTVELAAAFSVAFRRSAAAVNFFCSTARVSKESSAEENARSLAETLALAHTLPFAHASLQ